MNLKKLDILEHLPIVDGEVDCAPALCEQYLQEQKTGATPLAAPVRIELSAPV
jgi:hypothetical protein